MPAGFAHILEGWACFRGRLGFYPPGPFYWILALVDLRVSEGLDGHENCQPMKPKG
jgi:hypothetical protein